MATGLNGTCEIDTQCSTAVKDSECVQNLCKCFSNYEEVKGSCHPQKCKLFIKNIVGVKLIIILFV